MEHIELTSTEMERLQAELAELEGPKRREIVEAIAVARGHGDLSENFEYHAAKNEQGLLERQITILRDKIESATVVDAAGAGRQDRHRLPGGRRERLRRSLRGDHLERRRRGSCLAGVAAGACAVRRLPGGSGEGQRPRGDLDGPRHLRVLTGGAGASRFSHVSSVSSTSSGPVRSMTVPCTRLGGTPASA